MRYYDFSEDYLASNGETIIGSDGSETYVPFDRTLITYNEEWMTTSAFSFTIERDSRDMASFATNGSVISYTGEIAGGFLGGSWKYYKHLFSMSRYFPLFWGLSVSGKAQYGYISADYLEDIVYSQRFTPGGTDPDGSVRGYPDGELTAVTNTGTIIPGIAEAIYNVELQVPLISQQLYIIGFADAGNSWIRKSHIKPFSDLYRGVGVGFRLVIPGMGVIGFDFGYALDNLRDEGKGWRPHFQMSAGY